MIVLACLPPERLARLRTAVEGTHRVLAASDWAHADDLVRRQVVDVIVVDPAFGTAPGPAIILALRARFPSLPFVVHAALEAGTAAALATLGRAGFEHLLLHGIDDEPWIVRSVLALQPGVALSEQLMDRVRPALRHVPVEVSHAIERVIRTPAAFHGVPDLAAAAGVSRRTIYREFDRATLASPREVLAAARVLRAYALLREPEQSIEEVAAALRFSSAHHLTTAMRWACGMTTARARERVSPAEMLEAVAARIIPAPRDGA